MFEKANYLFRGFMPAVLILAIFVIASAQGSVGSTRGLPDAAGGVHSIEGHVYMPSGRRAGPGIVVKLDGNVNGTKSAATDGDGAFLFRSLPAAEYYIVVDGGTDYESVREAVTIYGNTGGSAGMGPTGEKILLDIHLQPKGNAEAEQMLAQFPKPAVDNYKKGLEAAHAGDSKKAVEFFQQAVSASPTFTEARKELGSQYLKLNSFDKAAEIYEELLKTNPADGSAHLELGIALYNQGTDLMGQQKFEDAEKKFNGCESHLREAVRLKVPGPVPHYYLGMMLIKFKAYDEAQKELQLAISNGGENLALAHRALGGVYVSIHKNKEAADELEKYLKLEPKAPDADRLKKSISDLRSKP